jgi:hypothetical protein
MRCYHVGYPPPQKKPISKRLKMNYQLIIEYINFRSTVKFQNSTVTTWYYLPSFVKAKFS